MLKKLATMSPQSLIGVDIAPAYLKKLLNENVPFTPYLLNAENLPFVDAFDLVVSSDVLEHVLNVGDFLHGVHRSLKKNGTFVVHVPYLEDYTVYSKMKGCKYDLVHLRNFSRYTLKTILEGAGFDVLKFKYDGYLSDRLRFCNFFRLRFSRSPLSFPGKAIRKFIRPFFDRISGLPSIPNWLGYLLMRPFGIAAICRKR